MPARALESRLAARAAVAGLALGLVALAGLAMWTSVSVQRATAYVESINRVSDVWGQVFQQVNLEQDTARDYLRAGTEGGRRPLANAVGRAEPHLSWLKQHGTPADVAAATQVGDLYEGYTSILREMLTLGDQGLTAEVALQADQGELAAASLRKQISVAVETRRLETTNYMQALDRENRQYRVASVVAFLLDVALLGVCSVILLGYQRRVERQAARSRFEALHDPLTGLPNRTLLAERTAQTVREADRYAEMPGLMLIDLDRFKEVNDTLGHHAGDVLLQEVGRRLQGAVRDVDTVARLGGDEFAILLPRVGSSMNGMMVAERILESFVAPVDLDGIAVEMSGSIGLAIYPADGSGPEELLKQADIAMYVAKRGRAGVVTYEPGMDEHSPAQLGIAAELRRALARREIILYYQPKAHAGTGEVCGVEALARWRHPERGLLGALEFIPVAEENGLIEPLTEYVTAEALDQCREWLAAGIEMPVSVNVGARCLHNEAFPDLIARLLAERGVPPRMLTLEITETAVVSDPLRTLDVLRRLEQVGVRLSIDDFATGYSAISYLRSMRVHEMKLDREFVTRMRSDPANGAIVRSLLDLGRNFGLQVVAEGVEDRETWAALDALGCDIIQGYHLSRPMPADALAAWLRAHRPSTAAPAL